jgi:adenylate cyclase
MALRIVDGSWARDWYRRCRTLVFGPPLPDHMPAAVADAIRRSQDASELIVGLVQIAAILTFAILYALAPKAFPPHVPFEPVPVALAVYAVFTGIRFWLALKRRLSDGFLAVSVVVDVSVLMLMVWSFHLQYQQPPALYLKAPTLMYVFILIALRALRFEPRWIVLCGACGACGWLLLLAYALAKQGSGAITHHFVDYATSYRILLGAEFDKVVSILMVTGILTLAVLRARNLLVQAAIEQRSVRELSRFFAPEVAGRIAGADLPLAPGQAELREAAILFADLRGFTQLAERLPPTEVMRLLAEYQAFVVEAVQSCGGSIDKFTGDGVLASFGAVQPSPVCARAAMLAVEEILARARSWCAERRRAGLEAPGIGLGVALGRVMCGTVGDRDRLEYTVIGEPVNLAAKLEKHCKVEQVEALATRDTLIAAEAQGYAGGRPWRHLAARRVEGVAAPIDLVAFVGPLP